MQCLHTLQENAAYTQVVSALRDIGPALRDFTFDEFYQWTAGLAAAAVTKVGEPVKDLLTGILGTSVEVKEFLKRSAVPEKFKVDLPAAFSFEQCAKVYFLKCPELKLTFPTGDVCAGVACYVLAMVPMVDAVLNFQDKSTGIFQKFGKFGDAIKGAKTLEDMKGMTNERMHELGNLITSTMTSVLELLKAGQGTVAQCEVASKDSDEFKRMAGLPKSVPQSSAKRFSSSWRSSPRKPMRSQSPP